LSLSPVNMVEALCWKIKDIPAYARLDIQEIFVKIPPLQIGNARTMVFLFCQFILQFST